MYSVPINFALNVIHGFFSLVYFGAVLIFGVFGSRLSRLSESTVSDLMMTVFPGIKTFVEVSGMITMVFGAGEFLLYMVGYYRQGGMVVVEGVLFSTGWGLSVLVGAVLGLVGYSMGLLINRNFERLFRLYRSLDPSVFEEIKEIEARLRVYSVVGMSFLSLAVVCMIVAVSFLPLPRLG